MRMWKISPRLLCRKHLLGEHVEMHMFEGCLRRGKRIEGYVRDGLVEVHHLRDRHDALAAELVRRGYRHQSPYRLADQPRAGAVDTERSRRELSRRCADCLQGGV